MSKLFKSIANVKTEKVLIDSHPINCVTFDDLYATLNTRIQMYRAASKQEK